MTTEPEPGAGAFEAERLVESDIYMDTAVTIEVVAPGNRDAASQQIRRAFGWFEEVERRCSRFDPESELVALCREWGREVVVSPLLFNVVRLALAVSEETGGAFDPTVGAAMEAKGFDRNYLTGERRRSFPGGGSSGASYCDVSLNEGTLGVTLRRPLLLDLGGVAKGFAMDLAGRELFGHWGFVIDAGGDLLTHGQNAAGEPWRVGVRHPRDLETVVETLQVSDLAVCTSGDYERPQPDGEGGHHILRPGAGESVREIVSVTSVGPTASLADAFATAAFVLGTIKGIELFERHGVEGLIITSDLARYETRHFRKLCM